MAKGGYQKQRIAQKHQAERRARKRRARNKKILRVVIPLIVVAMIGGVVYLATSGDDTAAKKPGDTGACTTSSAETVGKKTFASAPCMAIDLKKTYTAAFETSVGNFSVELLDDKAPKTVNNFVFLARNKFYEGIIFHRIIKGFMNQGGDPDGTGSGDPGYKFEDENTTQPFTEPGLLAMANSGAGTNGSQFFITVDGKGASHLNTQCPGPSGCHSVFGKVTSGLDAVVAMNNVKVGQGDRPEVNVTIRTITITEA